MKILVLITLSLFGFASAQTNTFLKRYGGSGTEVGNCVKSTSDGGYIVAGMTSSFGNGPSSIYLLKTNSFGDTLWTRTYGGLHFDEGFAVVEALDGGFVIAGQVGEPDTLGEGLANVYVLRTNTLGDTLWTFLWDAGFGDRAYSVIEAKDSSYVISGVLNSSVNFGIPTSFLLKLSGNGEFLWSKTFDNPSIAKSVKQTLDGGYALAGQYGSPPSTYVFLVKTNAVGDTVWTKKGNWGFIYGRGEDIIQTPDSGYVLTGSANNGTEKNIFLTKTDKFGTTLWTQFYGGSDNDYGYSVDIANDGGFIVTGGTQSYSTGQFTNTDIWLIKTDTNGDTLWTRTYGSNENEEGLSVITCNDGGFAITGYSGNQTDAVLLKTDSLGNAPYFTSVKDEQGAKSLLSIYPNPSAENITLKIETPTNLKIVHVTVYDCFGKRIKGFAIENLKSGVHHEQIAIDNLPSGQYFLTIASNGMIHTIEFRKL